MIPVTKRVGKKFNEKIIRTLKTMELKRATVPMMNYNELLTNATAFYTAAAQGDVKAINENGVSFLKTQEE